MKKLLVLMIVLLSPFIMGCNSKVYHDAVESSDTMKVKEFYATGTSIIDSAEIYFINNENTNEVSIEQLISEGYIKKGNEEYFGIVKIINGDYYIDYSNGEYKTPGLVSSKELNVNIIQKINNK